MTVGLHLSLRRRPTPGALYVAATAGFAVAVLALASLRLLDPAAVALIGVPLGPAGVVAAALALPVLTGPPSPALAVLVVAAALVIGVVNVLVVALIGRVAAGTPVLRR